MDLLNFLSQHIDDLIENVLDLSRSILIGSAIVFFVRKDLHDMQKRTINIIEKNDICAKTERLILNKQIEGVLPANKDEARTIRRMRVEE